MSAKERLIDDLLSRMTLEQKAGHCFTFGLSGNLLTPDLFRSIEQLGCAGLRYTPWLTGFGRYIDPHSGGDEAKEVDLRSGQNKDMRRAVPWHIPPEEWARLVNTLQDAARNTKLGIPLYFSVDQEGGLSHDLLRYGINLFPTYMGQKATGDPDIIYRVARATARQVRAMGMTWIHSPVVDVNINPRNPEIGNRSFSDDPQVVADCAALVVRAFAEEGVVATAKHFPGRGDSEADAHWDLPVLRADRARMDAVELLPYRRLIAEGVPTVMTAHTIYPAIDPELPASLSPKVLQGVLREELGFTGIITTDSITMLAIAKRYGVPQASAMAIQAGADVVLMKHEGNIREECVAELTQWVRDGKIPESRLDESIARVLGMKYDQGLFEDRPLVDPAHCTDPMRDPETMQLARSVARDCQILLRDEQKLLPLSPDQNILLIEQSYWMQMAGNNQDYHQFMLYENMLKHSRRIDGVEVSPKATPGDIQRIYAKIDDAEVIVITNATYRSDANQQELVKRLLAEGRRVVVVTDSPYPLGAVSEATTVLCNFSFNNRGSEATADMLFGKATPKGQLPVKL
jgi:beta-N-acetylhexosaminidase